MLNALGCAGAAHIIEPSGIVKPINLLDTGLKHQAQGHPNPFLCAELLLE